MGLAGGEGMTVLDLGPALDADACLQLLASVPQGCWFERQATGGASLLMVEPTHLLRGGRAVWHQLTAPAGSQPSGPFGFAGGYAGTLDYEAGYAAVGLPARHRWASAAVGYYPACLAIDHRRNRTFAVGRGEQGRAEVQRWVQRYRRLGCARTQSVPRPTALISPGPSPRAFAEQVRSVQAWIREGEVYVANLTYRIRLGPLADPGAAYAILRTAQPAPYGALVRDGNRWVLSRSPELLVARRGPCTWTRPIKGTRAAGAGAAAQLRADPKERAELAMIVDMARNDLGATARVGTVRAVQLYAVEPHPGLHHLVATIRAEVPGPAGALLRTLFPAGSVTGAPKRRAMELLAALEADPRGVYAGAIGYCDDGGDMQWAVAIRTLECTATGCLYGTGGGITIDSDPAREYAETLLKAQGPLRALGVAGWP